MKNYVKKYMGHDVPEGATHYHKGNSTYIESFYLIDGDDVMFSIIGNTEGWERSNTNAPPMAIELPEEPMPSKAEWAPSVGKECTVSYPYEDGNFKCFDGEKVLIISCGRCEMTSEYVYTGHNTKHGYVALSAKWYRPLKTSEEKKWEEFHLAVVDACIGIHSDDFNIDEIAGVLHHAGFAAPNGDK